MNAPEVEAYRFGPFVLEPRERQLQRGGVAVPLTTKAFDVLVALVRNHGRLVTKEALLAEAWPGVVVEEVNLTVNISAIRKALGAHGDWIETVPRHGYRFRGDVLAGLEVAPAEWRLANSQLVFQRSLRFSRNSRAIRRAWSTTNCPGRRSS
jgi:DNA-binding winged helix-turn-helix (wHTH) protein